MVSLTAPTDCSWLVVIICIYRGSSLSASCTALLVFSFASSKVLLIRCVVVVIVSSSSFALVAEAIVDGVLFSSPPPFCLLGLLVVGMYMLQRLNIAIKH